MGSVFCAGVDAHKRGWVAVVLSDGSFAGAVTASTFAALLSELADAQVIGVDIPIGIDGPHPRPADAAARKFIGKRWASVFLTPPRTALESPDYTSARLLARKDFDFGLTAQSFALAPRILEVDRAAQEDPRIIEVHPEVSFRAMVGEELSASKKTWNGMRQRMAILESASIVIPSDLGVVGSVPVDDVLDAAAVAWSAHRHARGHSASLPDGVDRTSERIGAIWY